MTEQDEPKQDVVIGDVEPADDRRTIRDADACPRVRGLVYFDLLLIGGTPLLLVFELIRRLVWFVKKLCRRGTPPPPQMEEQPPRTKAFGIQGFTTVCVILFLVEEFFIGLPYVFMGWYYIDHPNIEIPIEILLFPCLATFHALLFGPMFY
jgi:hypothetical protein